MYFEFKIKTIKMNEMRKLAVLFTIVLMMFASCKDSAVKNEEEEELEVNLRNTPTFPIGYAIQARHLDNEFYENLLENESRSITAEYEMKMSPMYNNQNAIDFDATDKLVNFAEENDIRVHGHALIWHSATPSWLENFNGSNAEFEALIENYIKEVVGRYKGQIESWDVVNEAFEDGSGHLLRNSVFRQKLGDDYIAKCFQWAREADPDVKLFYNDYGVSTNGTKLTAVLDMVDDLQAREVPIDGVGFQMHISHNWPAMSQIIGATTKVVNRDLLIHYSELDIRLNPDEQESSYNSILAARHVNRVNEIFTYYKSLPEEYQFGITNWGVKDDDTWLRNFWGNQKEWPLLFDISFQPKEAYTAIIEIFE